MNHIIKKVFLLMMLPVITVPNYSCKKFLDKKTSSSYDTPSNVEQLQALLDEVGLNQKDPSSGERSSDDIYLTYADWSSFADNERNTYTWEKDIPKGNGLLNEWPPIYQAVLKSNVVLDLIDNIGRKPNDESQWRAAKGHAYFLRGKSFFNVVTIWALGYDPQTASTGLGIPLRLDPDFTVVSVRSTIKESYDQIIADFKSASEYLPVIPLHITRPSLPSAYAFLARTYLLMQQYDSAKRYADLCLQLKSTLIDYNTVNANAVFPFSPRFSNPEIIYDSYGLTPNTIFYHKVDSGLYNSYGVNDLRKTVFFKNNGGSYSMKGNYSGSMNWFSGLATDEVYLIRAECRARSGDLNGALSDLNALLVKRWKTGFFQAVTANSATEAVGKILLERRKELLMRGLRWPDIKRLNIEGANITLTRKLNNQIYTLPPNHPRFALPIPDDVIQISGMPQNPR